MSYRTFDRLEASSKDVALGWRHWFCCFNACCSGVLTKVGLRTKAHDDGVDEAVTYRTVVVISRATSPSSSDEERSTNPVLDAEKDPIRPYRLRPKPIYISSSYFCLIFILN